ncbi:MAG: YceH family protein [Phycisphaerales bacterium]|nr:YceH family protein [Phycisphaerales bacterium]
MLTPHECRVLGVLIEKAQTTPGQYPLTLNSAVTGSNQKSNREPVVNLSEEQVEIALDGLRQKQLVREVMLSGSRVSKYRHTARDTLAVTTEELVILAELLLRGPQSIGELRGRATRMHPIESLEEAQSIVDGLRVAGERPMAYVRELPPQPGSRARRYAQLLCPDLHPLDAPASGGVEDFDEAAAPVMSRSAGGDARVERLEAEVASLKAAVRRLAAALGETDPFADAG